MEPNSFLPINLAQNVRLFVINTDGTHLRQLPWQGNWVGFGIWEPGNQSIVLGGEDKNVRTSRNWRIFLNDSPPVHLFDGCGTAVRSFSRPQIHHWHLTLGRKSRHLSIFPRRQKVHHPQVRHHHLYRLFRGGRKILLLLSRLQRPNHHLPPALAQWHPHWLPRPRPETPLRPARRLRGQCLHRLHRPLRHCLRPPQRPRRPLPPLAKITRTRQQRPSLRTSRSLAVKSSSVLPCEPLCPLWLSL